MSYFFREELNFRDFLKKVARFRKPSSNGVTEYNNREAKLQFLFGMYDLDMDNKISRSELLSVLQMMVGASVTMDQVFRQSFVLLGNHDCFIFHVISTHLFHIAFLDIFIFKNKLNLFLFVFLFSSD